MLSSQVAHNGVDISYDPTDNDVLLTKEGETSTRRHVSVDLVWKNLSFTVPAPKKGKGGEPTSKTILHSISGSVRAGTMLAVMGSSGAGKTSLLNLLAGRITSTKGAKASGAMLVNGQPRDYRQFRKLAAYVLQDDDMFAELTVEEQLTYAALLRLPASMPREKKIMRVNGVIQELGLSKVRTTMVGSQLVRGISGGERKRLNIGTELVTDPALLFLDEPTTGLDSFNALNVMSSLRQLASNGRTVVSTIHQPRSSIFALFDQLCLLSEGRVMYFGPARDAVAYFSALRFRSPINFNPADFFLDLLSIDPRSPQREEATKARVAYLGDKYSAQATPIDVPDEDDFLHVETGEKTEPVDANVDTDAGAGDKGTQAPRLDTVQLADRDYQSSWMTQVFTLMNRSFKLAFREKAANGARLGQNIFFGILLGLIWLRNASDSADIVKTSIPGILFFIVINQAFGGVFAVIFGFPLERSVVTRELAANTYRTSSYFLSKSLSDIPKTLTFNILFAAVLYWMVGFHASAGGFFLFVIVIFVVSYIAESLAIAVSIMTGDAQAAAAVIPVFIIMSLLFGGFFIDTEDLDGWIGWARYLSFVFYGFNALVKNEFERRVEDGMTELQDDLNNRYNSFSVWENIGFLALFILFYRALGYIFLKYLRGPKFLKF